MHPIAVSWRLNIHTPCQHGLGRTLTFKVDSVIDKGDVKETILDSAIQWHADLIVVGSHGSGGVRRFLLGSVAEAVARHAPCSVEIVRIHGGCHEGINF